MYNFKQIPEKEIYVLRFYQGTKGNVIAKVPTGKIVIPAKWNNASPGFYRVFSFEDREKSILIGDMNRVSYDYFPGISDKEFLKALHYMGFIIDIHQKVTYKFSESASYNYGYFTFAYDPKTNVVVTADSFDKGKIITRAEVFCPGLTGNITKSKLVTRRSETITVFSLTEDDLYGIRERNTGIIHEILKSMEYAVKNGTNVFDGSITPSIWGSREKLYENEDLESDVFHRQALEFEKDQIMELFKNDQNMMRIFSTVHWKYIIQLKWRNKYERL